MPIDIHAHYVPRRLIDTIELSGQEIGVSIVRGQGGEPAFGFEYGFSTRPLPKKLIESADLRRASLDRQDLDRQLVATWPDMYGYGLEPAKCEAWHRVLNDTLAEWCSDNASRFSWMASVPLINGVSAADELTRAIGMGALGTMIPANIEGINIGELSLDDFWSAAERLNAPVILHPVLTTPAPRATKFGLTQIVQYTFDTTLGVGSLLMNGVLDRYPKLTIILSHGGGAFPYLTGRFDAAATRMDLKAHGAMATRVPSDYASLMAYDTIVYAPKTLRFLADAVGMAQLVLGTDESFPIADLAPILSLKASGFSNTEIKMISEENPRRLFSRLK